MTEINKIMPAAFNAQEKQQIEAMMASFPDLQLQWGANPMYAPTLFGVLDILQNILNIGLKL